MGKKDKKSGKNGKAVIIDFIAKELSLGKKRGKILENIGKKWKIPTTTFDRYLKQAKFQFNQNRAKIEQSVLETEIEAAKKEAEEGILTKKEAFKILSMLAQGQKVITRIKSGATIRRKIEGTDQYEFIVADIEIKSIPTPGERRGAIETLAKMKGWNATDKLEVSGGIEGFTINIVKTE